MLNRGFLARVVNHKGQSIVEISLITPLLLVALYIPADFGIAIFTAHLTQNAVREAARFGASTDPFDNTAIQNEALNRMPQYLSQKRQRLLCMLPGPPIAQGLSKLSVKEVTLTGYIKL